MTKLATHVEPALWRDTERCHRAVASRDTRFDGQFITAVRTTGIYCRPSCPATPKPENIRFYPTAAAAQANGYRACRRCLPDAVPGSPEWNLRADLAGRAMRLISDGTIERDGVTGLAQQLGYSERQVSRVLTSELGAGPLALARAHRAHSARLLIELSKLPLTDVAFAAGFSSIRQFNDTIREVFASTPSQLRQKTHKKSAPRSSVTHSPESGESAAIAGLQLSLRLPFRKPFAAQELLQFFAARAIPGVEDISRQGDILTGYGRTLRLPHGFGLVWLTPKDNHVQCDLQLADVRDLGSAVTRVRRLFDLDADPEAIGDVLRADPALAPALHKTPGLRAPGAADGEELLIRAMLGQQISVAAARTAAGRLAAALGEPVKFQHTNSPFAKLTTVFPTSSAIAEHGHEILRGPRARMIAIQEASAALANQSVAVHVGRDPNELRTELMALPGIGSWTADYLLMRVLGAPDILLIGDLVLRKGAANLGLPEAIPALAAYAQRWRPWRSYAGMYLWQSS